MDNGVLILKTYEEIIGHNPGWNVHYIWWALAAVFSIGLGIIFFAEHLEIESLAIVCVMAGVVSGAIFIACILTHEPIKETRYVVLPTEDVGLIEFYNKYEVIEQDGLTYIVREKGE